MGALAIFPSLVCEVMHPLSYLLSILLVLYFTSPHLTSPHLTSPHLTSPHLTLKITSHPPFNTAVCSHTVILTLSQVYHYEHVTYSSGGLIVLNIKVYPNIPTNLIINSTLPSSLHICLFPLFSPRYLRSLSLYLFIKQGQNMIPVTTFSI